MDGNPTTISSTSIHPVLPKQHDEETLKYMEASENGGTYIYIYKTAQKTHNNNTKFMSRTGDTLAHVIL